ncbi:MAG: polyribonucleotide nucleotidyltransferase, partial [bacterium]|nr:polyribonucleotide nucleotidyltransferase [bacterium]
CALHMSDIPWNGPIGAIRVSKAGDEWLFNAGYEARGNAEFSLDIAGTSEKIVMIEAEGNEAKEDDVLRAFEHGRREMQAVTDLIVHIRDDIGKEKVLPFEPQSEEQKAKHEELTKLEETAYAFAVPRIDELFYKTPLATKAEKNAAKTQLAHDIEAHLIEAGFDASLASRAYGFAYDFLYTEATRRILKEDRRIDGRALTEIRPLMIEAGVLPRVHGSGHFLRGETQALTVCTLGAPGDAQVLDGMETVSEKRYMHHYNFLPFSVGEAKPLRGPGRREIGHGTLAEKALEPVLPEKADFPYTIRLVSETLSSNGSSSMASTCGSTLALMDAGVPIKKPVAGIAMGLASDGTSWKVLTDLQDIEDGKGGMDFKITGTRDGITAIQMDTKTDGLTHEIIEATLSQALTARLTILEKMQAVISEPRKELSPHAPRILSLTINPEKIREVIGSGGKTINEIIETTGVDSIDIEQDGTVMITSSNGPAAEQARNWIEDLTSELEKGKQYEGTVSRIMDFGAIVSVGANKDGMVHVSELAPYRVGKVEDIVKMGDTVQVKVLDVEANGRVSLSMKQAEGNTFPEAPKREERHEGEQGRASRSNGAARGDHKKHTKPPQRRRPFGN